MPAIGLRVVSNQQINANQEARFAAQREQQSQDMFLQGIAGHIERFWQAAQHAKRSIEDTMLRALRQRTGVYEPTDLALIRQQGGSEIFMMLTSAKCRGAESWLREILMSEVERPWGLEPTPIPDLPPAVQQAIVNAVVLEAMAAGWEVDDSQVSERLLTIKTLAYKRMMSLSLKVAERHELVIADQFAEGGWKTALDEFIYDLITFPAAFIKGPVMRMKKTLKWRPGPGGQWNAVVEDAVAPCYERRSPFDIFPAPAMRNIQYGSLIDRHHFTREHLQELLGVPGYSDDAITQVLEAYGERGYTSRQMNDHQRAILELRRNEEYDPEGTIEALDYWGSCPGHRLLEWHYQNRVESDTEIEPHREYKIEAWKVGRFVIKAQVNPNPLGKKPYSKASFENIAGAFWGLGLPDVIKDSQAMCNAAARSISNNAAIASGPQVEVTVDRLADGEPVTKMFPWKLWQTTTDLTGNNQSAIRFSQPQMHVQELLMIYQHFSSEADNESGFPKYSTGDSKASGAARTSSGLSQLMSNLGKGVRRVVANVDLYVIEECVARTFDYNMEYHPDPAIKFDLRPVARGSVAMLIKDQIALRQKEMLQATLNPLDAQIIGPRGRMEMLRPALRAAEFPVEKILPTEMELELAMATMPPPAQLLGKTGPNAAEEPGRGAGGGTPEGPENQDVAGNPPQGTRVREQTQGYRDGGMVISGMPITPPPRRFKMWRSPDGEMMAEEL
ncbi:MAG: hypothetical protein OEW90_00955 [Betaproteobacteria bacterium]|nr:hypothetical protein [Betaproteobacteria bacterium]MDH4322686.1 hypothetical protein [Betaproteobacteria bacterium]